MTPKLAVWKFASCDGCQLSLLDLEDELLALTGAVELADFREATSNVVDGPYDLSLVEGSVTTLHDAERIQDIRAASRVLVTIGACATAGGIQALRNFADIDEFVSAVYATPQFISTLATSTPPTPAGAAVSASSPSSSATRASTPPAPPRSSAGPRS